MLLKIMNWHHIICLLKAHPYSKLYQRILMVGILPGTYLVTKNNCVHIVLQTLTKLHNFIPLRIRQRLGTLWLVGRQLQWHQMLWRVSRKWLWLCSGRVSRQCIHHRIPCVECLPLHQLYEHIEVHRESWWVPLLNCCLLLENMWAVQHYMITSFWNSPMIKGPYYAYKEASQHFIRNVHSEICKGKLEFLSTASVT